MKKILGLGMAALMGLTLTTGCKNDHECPKTSLDDVNAFLNDSTNMNMNKANVVSVIEFNHINGPRDEWKFYALINYMFEEANEVKYQVTFLSCTCRTADVNYWSTAFVELSLPSSEDPADVVLKTLSFDKDDTGHYTAGFWGDSSPIHNETDGSLVATYDEYMDARKMNVEIYGTVYTAEYGENGKITAFKNGNNTYEVDNNSVDLGVRYNVIYSGGVATSLKAGTKKYEISEGKVNIGKEYTVIYEGDTALGLKIGNKGYEIKNNKVTIDGVEYTITLDSSNKVTSLSDGTKEYTVTKNKVTLNTIEYTVNVDNDELSDTYNKVVSITDGVNVFEVENNKVLIYDTYTLSYGDPVYVGKLEALTEGTNTYAVASDKVTIGNVEYTMKTDLNGKYNKLVKEDQSYDIIDNQVTIGSVTYTLKYETFEYGENDMPVSITNGSQTYDVNINYAGLFKDLDEDGHIDGNFYPTIKYEYIQDLLIGKTKAQIDSYNVMDDMLTENAMSKELFDSFTGASVSTNNILRMLHALFEYHAETFVKK